MKAETSIREEIEPKDTKLSGKVLLICRSIARSSLVVGHEFLCFGSNIFPWAYYEAKCSLDIKAKRHQA